MLTKTAGEKCEKHNLQTCILMKWYICWGKCHQKTQLMEYNVTRIELSSDENVKREVVIND